ncbi:hypothetical protein FA15DRAFT_604107 [Coprinopsis marcescibilis]|uniref:Heme haloperoxidase family profile domain-containing protein n=1 Tax=Coprinopsis marcescibilis TaxID=230819 RepID=A0A5C3KD50_COPMA|nr:hypothetical protein FA15DRAFT_604107 [Coprinopsis marcescibilis]
MANHGYISRDGKNLSAWDIASGLVECYGLTTPFAIFLSYTTFLLLRLFRRIDLFEIGRHGVVEHDASLVHHDTPEGQEFAPIEIDRDLLEVFERDAQTEVEIEVEVAGIKTLQKQILLSTFDVARARVRREKECRPVGHIAAEIARGEMAIILAVWEQKVGDKAGAPIEWIKTWLGEERLPEGWRADRQVGLFDTRNRAKAIMNFSADIRKAE